MPGENARLPVHPHGRRLIVTRERDHGKEMAEHTKFSVATGVPVYFCDPRSP